VTARRDNTAQDDAHREPPAGEHAVRRKQDSAGQGVVQDQRGQEQPADKKRATQNR
jgi:hypothetical protein